MPAFLLPLLGVFSAVPAWVWKALAIVAIVASVWAHGYIKGRSGEHARCEAAAQRAQAAANTQDKKADEDVKASERVTDTDLAELTKKQAARIKELETNAQVTSPSCIYPLPAPSKQPLPRGVRAQPARP